MKSVEVYVVNAFTQKNNGGNAAGVVLNCNELSSEHMQYIAAKMGFSETAFIISTSVNFHIRFFTPSKEVDLCGHATIASFHLLLEQKKICPGIHSMKTKVGLLDITCCENGLVYMQQKQPQFATTIPAKEVAPCLQIEEADFCPDIQIVSTGLRKIFSPINSIKTLEKIVPDYDKIIALSKKYQVVGIYTFTLDVAEVTARCRNFAPLYGIYEDAATGTSAAALSCYLIHHQLVKVEPITELSFQQGYSINKPSLLLTKIQDNKVEVAGTAFTIDKKQIILEQKVEEKNGQS